MNLEQSPISHDLLDQLARRFEWHAQNIYGVSSINSSPLYAQLSLDIATDPAILSLVAAADLSQQVSNLLLGAVHFFLLSGIASPLADYYPSLSPNPRPRHEAYTYFRGTRGYDPSFSDYTKSPNKRSPTLYSTPASLWDSCQTRWRSSSSTR